MITAPVINKPCQERWDEMRGNHRARLCEHCQLHVQNLSAMSRRDIARVLSAGHAKPVCITYVRGADGSLVTRATALREKFLALLWPAFACLLKALVPVALALGRTPQKKLFLGTWRVIERRRRGDKADRITFNEDQSFVAFTPSGIGAGKAEVRGSWCADEKNLYMWHRGRKHVWNIIELLPDALRLQSHSRLVVYKRVGKTPFQASNQAMPFRQARGPELAAGQRTPKAFGVTDLGSR
jgi:hypothetical protein